MGFKPDLNDQLVGFLQCLCVKLDVKPYTLTIGEKGLQFYVAELPITLNCSD